MTLKEGTPVHYLTHLDRLPIYNGIIVGGPFMTQDEPGEEPYEVYRVLHEGATTPSAWTTSNIETGHVELSDWPPSNGARP